MPQYASSPINKRVTQAVPGKPEYLLGSYNGTAADTKMQITSVALAGSTATVIGTVIEGNIPVAGQLVSIQGAVPSYFNVVNATVLSVSAALTPDAGVYTITFSLTNSNIGTTISPGVAVMPVPEVGEALFAGASAACSIQSNTGPENGRAIRARVSFPTAPGAAQVDLQGAMIDVDSSYQTIATISVIPGNTDQELYIDGVRANFVRFNTSLIAAGASAKIVGAVLV